MKNMYCYIIMLFICGGLLFCAGVAAFAQQGKVIVPNVEGISSSIAAQILRTAGLQPQLHIAGNSAALIIRQEPQAGTLLGTGSNVALFTSLIIPGSDQAVSMPRMTPAGQNETSRSVTSGLSPQGQTDFNVSVTPLAATQETAYIRQSRAMQQDTMNFILASQPQQAPASQYLLVESQSKRYPIWYPQAYLKGGSQYQVAVEQKQATTMAQPFAPSSVSPHLLTIPPASQQASYSEWSYVPQGWSGPRGSTYSSATLAQAQYVAPQSGRFSTTRAISTQTQYHLYSETAVPVPNVIRLTGQNAAYALQKAGLTTGNIMLVQNSGVRSGLVIKQSPRARAIVPAGTRIELWIAN